MGAAEQGRAKRALGAGAAAAVMVLALGVLAAVTRQPFLFPSLGPTIFIQVHAPRSDAARPWNTLVGHGVAIAAAVASLLLFGVEHGDLLSWRREAASALAVGLTTAGQTALKAAHPPGAATTLLISLGAVAMDARSLAILAAGVALTVALERALRPWLLRNAADDAAG